MNLRLLCCAAVALPAMISTVAMASPLDPDEFAWNVQVIIREDEQPFGDPQNELPRDSRGLAVDPTGRYVYAGYNTGFGAGPGEIRRVDTTLTANDQFINRIIGPRGKALATDDKGRVYAAEAEGVKVYDETLSPTLLGDLNTGPGSKTEGVAVVREGGQLIMYTSNRNNDTVSKWLLTESGDDVTAAVLDPTFGTAGSVDLGDNLDLRGVDVDGSGRIWVVGNASGKLFRVSAAGALEDMTDVGNAIDVAVSGENVLVTQFTSRTISLFNADSLMLVDGTIAPPWAALQLREQGEPSSIGALSGIALLPGAEFGFFVANEAGATIDDPIGPIDDGNEPILFVQLVPEPAGVMLGVFALLGLLGFSRRNRKRV